MNLTRLYHILKKEFTQLFRDRQLLAQIMIAPIIQLILFGYVVSTDVNNISAIVYDLDNSASSRQVVKKFIASEYFHIEEYATSYNDVKMSLDDNSAQVALVIPRGFAQKMARKESSPIQIIVDGSNSNTAGIALNYAQRILQKESGRIILEQISASAPGSAALALPNPSIRILYNPELKSVDYMIPGLVAMILTIITMLLTSVAMIRERERGTMEQLVVTPVRKSEIIMGKTLPFVIFAFIEITIVVIVGVLWFHVPIRGNIGLLFAASVVFLFSTLGLGLLFSTIARSQQEALVSSFLFFLVAMLLSGFIFPIESMPDWVQPITYIIPLRYFLVIVRGIFLKGVGIGVIYKDALAMVLFSAIIFSASIIGFRKKIS